MRLNSVFILVVAIVMGGIAAFLARNWLISRTQATATATTTTIVAASKPLPFGTPLTEDSVQEIPWAAKVTGPGQRASLSTLLDKDKRAITIRVDDVRGVAGFILPNDRVDVMLIRTATDASGSRQSDLLLQDVKVIAIDQIASQQKDNPVVAKAVTLEVTPYEAQKISLATNVGSLSLI